MMIGRQTTKSGSTRPAKTDLAAVAGDDRKHLTGREVGQPLEAGGRRNAVRDRCLLLLTLTARPWS